MSALAELARLKAEIRRGLQQHGTDVAKNDADPTGDGDQSSIHLDHSGTQFYRDLFSDGADMTEHAAAGAFSSFAHDCISGQSERVEQALKQVDQPGAVPDALRNLLETRETSNRMSPLLLVVAMGKNVQSLGSPASLMRGQLEVVRLLLRYGARPDAKDVCGKTVCHYGAGMMATDMTLQAVDMCIAAAETSHLLGKKVELVGLKKQEMNGKQGIVRGFYVKMGRRAVYLMNEAKPLAIKPENLQLVNEATPSTRLSLCDVQCRLGNVAMLEVFMASNRVDVAKFLLDHDARVDIADWDGYSPQSMASRPGADFGNAVARLVKERTAKQARAEKKAEKRLCTRCGAAEKEDERMLICSHCKSVRYCSKDCQVADWKDGHKRKCKELEEARYEGILLEKPPSTGMHSMLLSTSTGQASSGESFRKPDNVSVGQKFFVKVQGQTDRMPLMIYDETRQFLVPSYPPNLRGFREMLDKVQAEKAFRGQKTYMKASFDADGNCTVYPGTASIQKW